MLITQREAARKSKYHPTISVRVYLYNCNLKKNQLQLQILERVVLHYICITITMATEPSLIYSSSMKAANKLQNS